jgi:dTDP-4-dehydrorhamnose reductase
MLRLMAERPQLRVVDDQRGSPTYAAELAQVLATLIARDVTTFGTYHVTNAGDCTWHGFAEEIQAQALARGLLSRRVPIEAIPTSAYPTAASRPANSVLACDKIQALLALALPTWQDGLARHLARLRRPGTWRCG